MRLIFADTSFFYALSYQKDLHHQAAKEFLGRLKIPLLTTNYVFDELITILRYDFSHKIAVEYGEKLRSSKLCSLTMVSPEDEEAAWHIFLKYDDQVFSFTDCTSFAIMKRLGLKEAACFDSHFDTAGFIRLPQVPLQHEKS